PGPRPAQRRADLRGTRPWRGAQSIARVERDRHLLAAWLPGVRTARRRADGDRGWRDDLGSGAAETRDVLEGGRGDGDPVGGPQRNPRSDGIEGVRALRRRGDAFPGEHRGAGAGAGDRSRRRRWNYDQVAAW